MAKIHLLPDTLISQIAAGEVVERPASVVKELLENSIDAGATQCIIEVLAGGMKLIALRDNGSGMSPEDAPVAFARHATSKIGSLDDLHRIATFGFRGEALAAIASVAHVTMRTRLRDEESGVEVEIRGGTLIHRSSIGCPGGTEIIVRNLFFNTPARRKFVKTELTEFQHIFSVVSHMAAAHPARAFTLIHNGKEIFNVPAGADVPADQAQRERLTQLLGKDFVRKTVPVHFETPSICITGFIGGAGFHAPSKRHQYLFVNGRDVTDALVIRAVIDAYGSRLPPRSQPIFLLHIAVPPEDVDVNVHPRKLSVKFVEPQRIFRDVSQAVHQALDALGGLPLQPNASGKPSLPVLNFTSAGREQSVQEALEFTQNFLQQPEMQRANGGLPAGHTPIGYFADSYIVMLDEEGLALIDQHAAHERIMYEKFRRQLLAQKPDMQKMLLPVHLDLSHEEKIVMETSREHLEKLGFEIEAWSGETFVIYACPSFLQRQKIEATVRDVLDDFLHERDAKASAREERLIKTLACKAAVKFGMPLTSLEQQNLTQELARTANNITCPHGRPTRIVVTFDELERRFGRRK